MTLLIMAAGMGSRYGGLKQLDGVGPSGELIIDYSIFDAISAGFDKVVFVIREEHKDLFEEKIASAIRPSIKVEYAFQDFKNVPSNYDMSERTKPLGTGHAILCGKEAVAGDDFVVINADDFYSRTTFKKACDYLKTSSNNEHCMVAFHLKNTVSENGTVSRGVCYPDNSGYLTDILEHEKINKYFKNENEPVVQLEENTMVSMNFWGFKASAFDIFEQDFNEFLEKNKEDLSKCEFYLTTPVKKIVESDKHTLKVLETDAKWYGVTYIEDKPLIVREISKMHEENIYPQKLWK